VSQMTREQLRKAHKIERELAAAEQTLDLYRGAEEMSLAIMNPPVPGSPHGERKTTAAEIRRRSCGCWSSAPRACVSGYETLE